VSVERQPARYPGGSITHHLHRDVPETAVGDRANVSQDVLEQRRQYLDNV
jgi:hypothetical protein